MIRNSYRKRAFIEPIIEYLKQNYRVTGNFCKGIVADNIDIMRAAAAFNVKKMIN